MPQIEVLALLSVKTMRLRTHTMAITSHIHGQKQTFASSASGLVRPTGVVERFRGPWVPIADDAVIPWPPSV